MNAATPETVLHLAQTTPELSEEQLRRISDVVHFMNDEDLQELHGMLLQMQKVSQANLQHEYEVRKNVAAKYREFQTDKARGAREGQEASQRVAEEAAANTLISKI